jgi:hypothetical protein
MPKKFRCEEIRLNRIRGEKSEKRLDLIGVRQLAQPKSICNYEPVLRSSGLAVFGRHPRTITTTTGTGFDLVIPGGELG